ncbi:MAG: hypothetical protein AXW12_07860 [Thalassospira sp. Nap_22]|nr:MAG: hypothetical protein AXW12_07860 [Thalassospira sp. Nap_22]
MLLIFQMDLQTTNNVRPDQLYRFNIHSRTLSASDYAQADAARDRFCESDHPMVTDTPTPWPIITTIML